MNLVEIVCNVIDVVEIVMRCFTKILSLLIMLTSCWDCLQDDWSDLSFAKKLFECLLTMIIFFYEYDKRC